MLGPIKLVCVVDECSPAGGGVAILQTYADQDLRRALQRARRWIATYRRYTGREVTLIEAVLRPESVRVLDPSLPEEHVPGFAVDQLE